jgi:hypothetical protein
MDTGGLQAHKDAAHNANFFLVVEHTAVGDKPADILPRGRIGDDTDQFHV